MTAVITYWTLGDAKTTRTVDIGSGTPEELQAAIDLLVDGFTPYRSVEDTERSNLLLDVLTL